MRNVVFVPLIVGMTFSGCSGSSKPGTAPVCPSINEKTGSITFFKSRGTSTIVAYASCFSGLSVQLKDVSFESCPTEEERESLKEKLVSACSSNGSQNPEPETTDSPLSIQTGAPNFNPTTIPNSPITTDGIAATTPAVVPTVAPTQPITTKKDVTTVKQTAAFFRRSI